MLFERILLHLAVSLHTSVSTRCSAVHCWMSNPCEARCTFRIAYSWLCAHDTSHS